MLEVGLDPLELALNTAEMPGASLPKLKQGARRSKLRNDLSEVRIDHGV
jgi:hypothetical protein